MDSRTLPDSPAEKLLALVLRGCGAILCLSFFAVLMPTSWMESVHRQLKVGAFPESFLVEYLTRSVSALYAVHGVLYFVLARDVRRYASVITYVAWSTIAFGVAMLVIDLKAGAPGYWTLLEGPGILLFGVLYLVLVRRVGRFSIDSA